MEPAIACNVSGDRRLTYRPETSYNLMLWLRIEQGVLLAFPATPPAATLITIFPTSISAIPATVEDAITDAAVIASPHVCR